MALAGWVCSCLWCFPVGLDWMLLLRGDRRSSSGARRVLSLACHLTWLVAAGLALPLVRADATLISLINLTEAEQQPGGEGELSDLASMQVCTLQNLSPTWWPHVLLGMWVITAGFNLAVYSIGTFCTADHTPRVVFERHRLRAMQIAAAFGLLQPPSAALFWYLLEDGIGDGSSSGTSSSIPGRAPPLVVSLWAIFAGVPLQGALNALAYFWHEPGALTALCASALSLCDARATSTARLNHGGGSQPSLHHHDSRFVHFRREDVEGGGNEQEANGDDVVNRVLAEERQSVPFRLVLMLVPVAIVILFFALVVGMHV